MGHRHTRRGHCERLLFKGICFLGSAEQNRLEWLRPAAAHVSAMRKMHVRWSGTQMGLEAKLSFTLYGRQDHEDGLGRRKGPVVRRILERPFDWRHVVPRAEGRQ